MPRVKKSREKVSRRAYGLRVEAALRHMRNGLSLREATKRAGITEKRFRDWIADSKAGRVSDHYAAIYLELTGRPCDLCGQLVGHEERASRKEYYMGSQITLFWHKHGCADEWDLGDEEEGEKEWDALPEDL